MTRYRGVAVLLLAASLYGGAAAQERTALDDETIFIAVEDALLESRFLPTARIAVHSRYGFVTLSGSARTVREIAAAGRVASGVRGVTGVNNEIRITDRASRA